MGLEYVLVVKGLKWRGREDNWKVFSLILWVEVPILRKVIITRWEGASVKWRAGLGLGIKSSGALVWLRYQGKIPLETMNRQLNMNLRLAELQPT